MNVKPLGTKENFFYAFLIYSFISFAISVTSFVLFREIEKIDKTAQLVSSLKNKIQDYIRLDNDFLLYETINSEYFRTEKSQYIDRQNVVAKEISVLTDSILRSERAMAFHFDKDILSFEKLFQEKEILRKEIFKNIYQIGFKDYGLMGKMRKSAHAIENVPEINMASLLMLRRHEKDYFLRNDTTYISKHQKEKITFNKSILNARSISSEDKNEILKELDNYSVFFDKIVQLERYTGYRNNTGLMYQMKVKTEKIDALINHITFAAEERKADILKKIQIVIVVMVTLSILLLLMLVVSFNFVIRTAKI